MSAPSSPARRAPAAFALALLGACSSGSRERPAIRSIEPARIVEGAAATVTIQGDRLTGRAYTDFESASGSALTSEYTARLGSAALRAVRLVADGTLSAVVPEGLAAGTYDLVVTDPWGNEALLSGAFRVVAPSDLSLLVAAYRVDPIGPQRVGAPFGVTVTAVDDQGAEVPYATGAVWLTDLTASAVPSQAGSFVKGRWTGPVEVRQAHLADVLTVTDDRGRTGHSAPFAVAPRDPARLAIGSAPQQVVAGACSAPVQVGLLDRAAFQTSAPAAIAVALEATPADGFSLFRDPACEQPLDAAEIAAGASGLTLYFRAHRAGVVQLAASALALDGDAQLELVTAASPARLAFVSPAQTLDAGACSSRVRLESQDVEGNAAPVLAPEALALAVQPSGLSLFVDPACATPLAGLGIPAGSSSASFYFSGSRAGPYTLQASSADLGGASQRATIGPAAPDHLSFVTAEQTTVEGGCSAAAIVELRDRFENPSPAAAAGAIALSASPPDGLAFFAGDGCGSAASSLPLAAGGVRASFSFRGSAPADYALTAALPGAGPASQIAHVKPPLPDHVSFASAPQQFVAGTCSGLVTVEARDPGEVPRASAADQVVALSASALSFFSDASCLSPIAQVALRAGATQASFYVSGTRAGAQLAAAAVAGWRGGSQAEQVQPDVGDRLGFLNPEVQAFAGECSAAVAVAVEDRFENPSPVSVPATISLSAAPPEGFQLYADALCTIPVSSVSVGVDAASAEIHFRGVRASTVVVFAASGGLKSARQTELVRAKVPDRLTFMTPPRAIEAGNCSGIVTLQAQDVLGNPVALDQVTAVALASNAPPDLAFYSDGSCAVRLWSPAFAAGSDSLSFYLRATTAGTYSVSATAFNAAAAQAFAVSPGPTAALSWDPIASPQPGGVPFPVALRAKDGFDNPTPGFAGSAALSLAPAGGYACVSGCSGATTTAPFTAGAWTGTVRVDSPGTARRLVAVSGAFSVPSNPFDVLAPPAASAPLARLTASPAAVVLGEATLLDASGSLDYQTATAQLSASWDFSGAATSTPPWTAWAGLSASQTWPAEGLYFPRVAVRDADGELAYATTPVAVVAAADLCTVTTASLDDDGAAGCEGPYGPDGQLSLAEAVRLANEAPSPVTISFAGPMSVSGASPLALTSPAWLLGGAGVVLRVPLQIGARVLLGALAVDGATVTVLQGGELTGFDLSFTGGAGLVVRGAASLSHLRMRACGAQCIADEGSSALNLQFAELLGGPSSTGLAFKTCAASPAPAELQSVVFAGLAAGVRDECGRGILIHHATFAGNGQGAVLSSSVGDVLEDSIFTDQSIAAVACGGASFASRQRQLLWGNASDGCLAGDAGNLAGAPRYTYPEALDFRPLPASPAVDAAPDRGVDVNGEAPGLYCGASPDLGGLESH